MIIYVDNHSNVQRNELREVIAVMNRQIERDFTPIWGLSAQVIIRSGERALKVPPDGRLAHIHLTTTGEALGYHIEEQSGIPAGFVMTDLSEKTRSALPWLTWTVALSHEVLELVADPFLNLLAKGPHPQFEREVFHYREICDPVQGGTYEIGGVSVSNFVLPHYYNAVGQKGLRNDYLDEGVKAFRWMNHGYIGFWDPRAGARGKYVVYPQRTVKDPSHRALVAKGRLSRLRRYEQRHDHVDRR
ncbi:MAG: hypothetical protein ACT4OZ_01070 [Gemmatimonadota bacterium]